jgi:hypothetical protein
VIITISDEQAPGQWDVDVVAQRKAEKDVTRLKIATILIGIGFEWLKEEAIAQPAAPPPEEKPQIMLPGRDFPGGSLPPGV